MARDGWLRRATFDVVNTTNAIRPFDRHSYPSALCWLTGFPTSELPLTAFGAEVGLTALNVARGEHRGPKGKLSLALQAVSLGGLAYLQKAAHDSADVLADALTDVLGERVAGRTRLPGVIRTAGIRRRFVTSPPISYGDAGEANTLDIWRRPDLPRDAKAPVVIQIPGGAWVVGDRRSQAYPQLAHLASLGWVGVSISYRLGPKHKWPSMIVDVKRAIAWVREHIAEWGGDPDFIAITGGSAGGHLSSLAALTPNDPSFQPGFEAADTSVVACVPFYGVYDFTNRDGTAQRQLGRHLQRLVIGAPLEGNEPLYDAASPMSRVNPDAPPFFVLHGVNDSFVPVEQADGFVRLLREASRAPVAYARMPHAQHAFDLLGSLRARNSAIAMALFLEHVRKQRGHA